MRLVPTALKELNNFPGGHKNQRAPAKEPRYEATKERPPWLNAKCFPIYDRVAEVLSRQRVLTVADVDAMGRYADIMTRWLEASEFLHKFGTCHPIYETKVLKQRTYDSNGNMKIVDKVERVVVGSAIYPQFKAYRELGLQALAIEREFGLTPASRTKIYTTDLSGNIGAGVNDDSDLE